MNAPLTAPAERCYWVRLPASPRRWTATRVAALAEPLIPDDVDRLQFAWSTGADGTLVAVALDPAAVTALAASDPEQWLLHPDHIPEDVATPGVAAADLNLLTGACAPSGLLRRRRQLAIAAAGLALVLTLLVAVGTWRRWAADTAAAAAIDAAGGTALAARLPVSLAGNDPDPLLRLDQARRMLGAVHSGADNGGQVPLVCQRVLAAWPAQVRAQMANLSLDGTRLTISGTVATVEEAQSLATAVAAALAAIPGWRMLPLQATRQEHDVACTLTAQFEAR